MERKASLKVRSVRRLAMALTALAAILFLSAGSLHFWPGWLFVVLQSGFWIFFCVDFLKHDPQLLERRLQNKETQPEQKLFQALWSMITILAFILAGLDFRFGWTRGWVGQVPLTLVLMAQAMVVGGYWLVFWVMKTNTFAGSTIQVESKQTVICSGPYAIVRHPMYFGMVVAVLAAPLALASYVTVPVFALLVPMLVFRLTHEEQTLRRDLLGYTDYCERTRFRLVPWVW
jgi:protein-S-isoprenylcysteine O-methyltransferase Ste14